MTVYTLSSPRCTPGPIATLSPSTSAEAPTFSRASGVLLAGYHDPRPREDMDVARLGVAMNLAATVTLVRPRTASAVASSSAPLVGGRRRFCRSEYVGVLQAVVVPIQHLVLAALAALVDRGVSDGAS